MGEILYKRDSRKHDSLVCWGPKKNGVYVNEVNLKRLISYAGTGFAFIQWCNGQVIKGYEGQGVIVKFNGFVYIQLGSAENRTKVIPIT